MFVQDFLIPILPFEILFVSLAEKAILCLLLLKRPEREWRQLTSTSSSKLNVFFEK